MLEQKIYNSHPFSKYIFNFKFRILMQQKLDIIKSLVLISLFFIQLLTCFIVTNLRYSNQGLRLDEFGVFKTGNLICFVLFGLIILLILLNFFTSSGLSLTSLIIIFFASIAGILTLILFNFIAAKDEKILYGSVFLFITMFVLCGLYQLYRSKSGKLSIIKTGSNALFLIIVGIFIIFLNIYLFHDDYRTITADNGRTDAGIIFGAAVWGGNRPSPVLRERINKGFELYKDKIVPRLVLTGGGSPNEMTEADVARNELIKYGVKDENLILENTSNSTLEQIFFLRDKLYRRLKWDNVILISDNYHLYRIKEICSFNNINSEAVATEMPLSIEGKIWYCVKESFAVLMFWFYGIG